MFRVFSVHPNDSILKSFWKNVADFVLRNEELFCALKVLIKETNTQEVKKN